MSKARSFVRDALHDSGLDDVADDGQLLISELVTNVVLHAGTALQLRCYVWEGGARFEVRDGSPVLPGIRRYDVMSMTGRGLGLVDAIASRWGAGRESEGKVVWFEMGRPDTVSPPAPTAVRGHDEEHFSVRFERLPVALVRATLQHGDALLRDIALRDMGQSSDPALWRSPQIDLTPVLAPVADAHTDGVAVIDVDTAFPVRARTAALERLVRVNDADELARAGDVETAAGLPELRLCRTWLLSQIALQAEGATPTPWELVDDLEPIGAPLELTAAEQESLQNVRTALVIADTTHRITFATDAAGVLLGWHVPDLIGRRLSTLVPVREREAHLAGFAHYAITKEPRLLGSTVRVSALQRSGQTVEVALTLRTVKFCGGDAFAADFEAIDVATPILPRL